MTTETNELNCEDTTWLVSDARERSLTVQEKAGLKRHIDEGERCQGACHQFEVLFRQLSSYIGKTDPSD